MSSVPKGATRSVGQFEKLAKVGEGTYGSVYKARDRETGGLVALKRVKLGGSGFDREGMPLTSLREIALLRRLRHPNVVRLHEVAVARRQARELKTDGLQKFLAEELGNLPLSVKLCGHMLRATSASAFGFG